jgi:hypothetical protein
MTVNKPGNPPHVSAQRHAMLVDLFGAIDTQNVNRLLNFMTPTATQRFGNQEPLVGRDEIRAGNEAFFASIAGLRHEIVDAWESHGTVAIRLNISYVRLDGAEVAVPGVTMLHERDGLIDTYEIFLDMAPVFAR